jgi:hypothetical protein
MAEKNLMSAISGLADAKPDPEKVKAAKKKPKVVNLGKGGSFTIKHPGAETAAAKRAGKSVHEYAEEHKHDSGTAGARARSALGFEAMHHGKK